MKKDPTLVLTGGASNGGLFELGFLIYFDLLIEDNLRRFNFIGTSVGSMIAAMLAFGATPQDLVLAIRGKSKKIPRIHPFKFYSLRPSLLHMSLVNGSNIEKMIRRVAKNFGVSNRTRDYRGKLIITASNIDTAKPVLFGLNSNLDHVPVSLAVQASCAIPFLFNGVEVQDRKGTRMTLHDGGISKTAHILDTIDFLKSEMVVVCNPLRPIDKSKVISPHHHSRLRGRFFMTEQIYRIFLQSRLDLGKEVFAHRYPDKHLVIVEPQVNDTLMFRNPFLWGDGYTPLANPYFTVELGYLRAKEFFEGNEKKLRPIFEAHGLPYNTFGGKISWDKIVSCNFDKQQLAEMLTDIAS